MKRITPSYLGEPTFALWMVLGCSAALAAPVPLPAKVEPKHEIVLGIHMSIRGSYLEGTATGMFRLAERICPEIHHRPARLVAGRIEDAARFETQSYVSGADSASYSTNFVLKGTPGNPCEFTVVASHTARISHYENGRSRAVELDLDKSTARKLPEGALTPAIGLDPAAKAQWLKGYSQVGERTVAGFHCRVVQTVSNGMTTQACLIDDKSLPEPLQETAISVETKTGGAIFSQWAAETIAPAASFDRAVFELPRGVVPK